MLSSPRPRLKYNHHHTPNSSRLLWWWSRQPSKGCHVDESFDCHMRRQQRLMIYRYAKNLRRRVTWDREPTQDQMISVWPCYRPRWAKRLFVDNGYMSSRHGPELEKRGSSVSNKTENEEVAPRERQTIPGRPFEEGFEQFKRRIHADPYGAVFGRRLEHTQPTSTFLKWFFDPDGHSHSNVLQKTSTTKQANVQESISSDKPSESPESPSSTPSADAKASRRFTEVTAARTPAPPVQTFDDYEYDPITMRKVHRHVIVPSSHPSVSVGDDEVNIPVKKFSSHEPDPDPPLSVEELSPKEETQLPENEIAESPSSSTDAPEPPFTGTASENSSKVDNILNAVHQNPAPETRIISDSNVPSNLEPVFKTPTLSGPQAGERLVPALDHVHSIKDTLSNPIVSKTSVQKRQALEKDYDSRVPEDNEIWTVVKATKNKYRRIRSQLATPSARSNTAIPSAAPESNSIHTPPLARTTTVEDQNSVTKPNSDHQIPRTKVPKSVPLEVQKARDEEKARTLQMQHSSAAAHEADRVLKFRDMRIATALKALYEEWYGTITFNHRQQQGHKDLVKSFSLAVEENVIKNNQESKPLEQPGGIEDASIDLESTNNTQNSQKQQIIEAAQELSANFEPVDLDERQIHPPNTDKSSLHFFDAGHVDLRLSKLCDIEKGLNRLQEMAESSSRTLSEILSTSQLTRDEKKVSSKLNLYKILAFDPETSRVNIAKTTTSALETRHGQRPTSDILSQLDNASKFLPHFAPLYHQGYELVSGSRDTLVFKQVRLSRVLPQPEHGESIGSRGTTAKQQREASRSQRSYAKSPNPGPMIQRQEEVFSGSRSRRNHDHAGPVEVVLETWKRVLLGGALTAAFCYLVGAATELFRGEVEVPKSLRPGMYSTEDAR